MLTSARCRRYQYHLGLHMVKRPHSSLLVFRKSSSITLSRGSDLCIQLGEHHHCGQRQRSGGGIVSGGGLVGGKRRRRQRAPHAIAPQRLTCAGGQARVRVLPSCVCVCCQCDSPACTLQSTGIAVHVSSYPMISSAVSSSSLTLQSTHLTAVHFIVKASRVPWVGELRGGVGGSACPHTGSGVSR
jgi:hypothetical protein